MSALMEQIKKVAAAEQAPNPKCQEPDDCRWAKGLVSCWRCASAAQGGSVTDFSHGLIKGTMKERDPNIAAKSKSTAPRKRDTELEFGSDKWKMYANAIPKQVRGKLCTAESDVRALYKELRSLGKDEFLKKYGG